MSPPTSASYSGPAIESPFPTPHLTRTILLPPDKTPTTILLFPFSDKILITITQAGRLSQWVQVPLAATTTNPAKADTYLPSFSSTSSAEHPDDALLPDPSLTPSTIFGGASNDGEIWAHLIATQIASAIRVRDPEEARTVVLGLGVDFRGFASGNGGDEGGREAWMDLVEGVVSCLS